MKHELFALLALLSFAAVAANADQDGPYTYTVTNGVATITHFDPSYAGALSITNTLGDNPVAAVGDRAFYQHRGLTGVTIPRGVTNIGALAFFECKLLSSIAIPGTVVNIGDWAFARCFSLRSVTLGNGVIAIGSSAFLQCSHLPALTIPDSVTVIGDGAFGYCMSLTNIALSASVTRITKRAFAICPKLAGVNIPSGVTAIEAGAFHECTDLTNIIIPASVTAIEPLAFYSCRNLQRVYFGGDPPNASSNVFHGATNVTVYYRPGATGWGPTFAGRPALPWDGTGDPPQVSVQPAVTLPSESALGDTVVAISADSMVPLREALHSVQVENRDELVAVAWSRDGKIATAGGSWNATRNDPMVKLWDIESATMVGSFRGHDRRAVYVAFSPDSRQLASSAWDQTVRIWDTREGGEVAVFQGHTNLVRSVTWSGDGQLLASASWDATARIWDARTWRALHILRGHRGGLESVAFSPDGKRLATAASGDATTRIWDVATGKEIVALAGDGTAMLFAAWSPDGQWLVTTAEGGGIRIWNTHNWKATLDLVGHRAAVHAALWSPDGRRLASGSRDRMVRVWNIETRKSELDLVGCSAEVRSVAWSPDGAQVAAAVSDGTVKVWQAIAAETKAVPPRRPATTNTPAARPRLPSAGTRYDTEALQGVWLVKRSVVEGMKFHMHEIQGLAYTFTDDTVARSEGKRGVRWQSSFTLNSSAVPKWIDLRQGDGKRRCGIYKLDHDRLSICLPSDDNTTNRPTAFASTWTMRTELTELERLKPGAQIPAAFNEDGKAAFTSKTRAEMFAALERDPTDLQALTILCLGGAADDQARAQSLSRLSREDAVAQAIGEFKKVDKILATAIQAGGVNAEVLEDRRLVLQETYLSTMLLADGTNYVAEAGAVFERVKEYIHSPSFVHSIHNGLGRIALQANKLSSARYHLRNAGKVLWAGPNFDPDMKFAHELLEHGDKEDREAVLAFLDDVIRSRRPPGPNNAAAQSAYAGSLKRFEGWRQDVRDGKTPLDW